MKIVSICSPLAEKRKKRRVESLSKKERDKGNREC